MHNPLQNSIMSITARLNDDFSNVPVLIAEYEDTLEQLKKDDYFNLEGKSLLEAHRDYAATYLKFKCKLTELDVISNYVLTERNKQRAKLWKQYTEGYSRALSDRQIERYIEGDEEYINYHKIYLEVNHIKAQYADICEALDKMSYRLKDYTTLQIENMRLVVM